MLTVADVIFPAFYTPYVVQIFYPLAAIMALCAEVIFYRWWSKDTRLGRLILMVVVVNIVSSVSGMLVASCLPTGYNPAFHSARSGPWRGPGWNALATIAWIVAFIVSVLIEWPLVLLFRRMVAIPRAFLGVLFANASSYVVLLVILFMSIQASRG
jgi:hypothetical protein